MIRASDEHGLTTLEESGLVAVEVAGAAEPVVWVLIHHTGTAEQLAAAGVQVSSTAGDIASGRIPVSRLDDLERLETVVYAEAGRGMHLDLDVSVAEVNADDVHELPAEGTPPARWRGRGVIVGIVDTGIDYTHPAFRDSSGNTRILRIWDQHLAPMGSEHNPADFPYGVEYTQADIDNALATANPTNIVRTIDYSRVGHGTHVAGIAAGDGNASGTFAGIAPEADLIVVAARGSSGGIGTSTTTFDAVNYIFTIAESLGRPAVVNMSLGDNLNAHDGTANLELGIDNLLGAPGRAMVKSAGNAAVGNIHATGTVPAGGSQTVQFTVPANDVLADLTEIWYSGRDRFAISVTDPAGNTVGPVAPGNITSLTFPGGNRIFIQSDLTQVQNNENRIFLGLQRDTALTIQPGNWSFTLTGTTVVDGGRFHAWIQRSGEVLPQFTGPAATNASTISTPGTSREVITVGSYVTRPHPTHGASAAIGDISTFSSRGPTRDGRFKPDLVAPGEWILSARASTVVDGSGLSHFLSGTSMAAPHVAGTIALILQRYPRLTNAQIRQGLIETARTDGNTGSEPNIPNHTWGYGKLDTLAAFQHTYTAPRPRNWVRIRPVLYNWTLTETPPTFEIDADENGTAVIELAWDPQALLNPATYAAPLRYYSTAEDFSHTISRADGGTLTVTVPAQPISLSQGRFSWTMPQALWDGYREEARKSLATPPGSAFARRLYYRVRYQPTGASSALLWPPNASIENNPNAPSMGIIALNTAPSSRVVPDQAAVDAMGGIPVLAPNLWGDLLMLYWRLLPESSADRQSLVNIFGHRFFMDLETEVRGKILRLWLFSGRMRQHIPDMLTERFRSLFRVEITVFEQPDLHQRDMLIDHLLAMTSIHPHRDITGILTSEQLIDDVLAEIADPNGQNIFGTSGRVSATGLNAFMILYNAAEYVRLLTGLMSTSGQVTMANGDTLEVPEGVYRVQPTAPPANPIFVARRYAELGLLAAVLKYAQGSDFPSYDPAAAVYDPNGVGQALFSAMRRGLTEAQMTRALSALTGRTMTASNHGPAPTVRDQFRDALRLSSRPLLLTLWWDAEPGSLPSVGGHAVVALREDAGRIFFRNPLYAGTTPLPTVIANTTISDPPRRHEDPTMALESIGDADLGQWIMWFHS
jgi:subtilisin family serine protease